jgi:hypothetical protein
MRCVACWRSSECTSTPLLDFADLFRRYQRKPSRNARICNLAHQNIALTVSTLLWPQSASRTFPWIGRTAGSPEDPSQGASMNNRPPMVFGVWICHGDFGMGLLDGGGP